MSPAAPSEPPVDPPTEHDVLAGLIELSRPRPVFRHIGIVVTLAWMTIFIAYFLPIDSGTRAGVMAMAFIIGAGGVISLWGLARSFRIETAALERAEDAAALKQYALATDATEQLMSRPFRSPQNRLRAMVLLATLRARQRRFEEALRLYEELLETERIAGPGGAVVRLGRAMVMLQSDHLYDADRAINDLRRLIDRGGAAAELAAFDAPAPAGVDPLAIAGLRLVELYRDIKTGHFREAVSLFEQSRDVLRQGLSHRLGEAMALVAVAHDVLNETLHAAERFAQATALQPVVELIERYPEIDAVARKYPITRPPPLH